MAPSVEHESSVAPSAQVPPMAPVSVIIPCFRCAHTIERAAESVLNQTMLPQELILVEDNSQDSNGTLGILKKIQDSNTGPVKVIILPLRKNVGAGEARNVGWETATQDYIAFLDADDSWHPEKISYQYKWMKNHPEFGLSCHLSVVADSPQHREWVGKRIGIRDIRRLPMLFRNQIPTRTVMARRSLEQRFPAGIRYAEDYRLWLTMLSKGVRVAMILYPFAYSYRAASGQEGLSSHWKEMHRGVLACYRALYLEGAISRGLWFSAATLEHFKLAMRLARAGVRKTARLGSPSSR